MIWRIVFTALFVGQIWGACPAPDALAHLRHQIAYQRTEELDALRGLEIIHLNIWSRGHLTGFYIQDRLGASFIPGARMTFIFGQDGLQGGGTCPAEKNWRECLEEFAGNEVTTGPVTTCETTIDLRSIPAWEPSPNDQKKQRIAAELRKVIEAHFEGAQVQAIVVRDFNLMDNQITMYVKMPDGDYFQGCGFYANSQPHCDDWHLFGQAPLSSIQKWIFARPYRLK